MTTDQIETASSCSYRGFSEWWNAETDYLLQRIERWAAFIRGYNRLRSERISKGRMTMYKDEQWTYVANPLTIDETCKIESTSEIKSVEEIHSKHKSEEMKLNCCGTFNYKSNGNLDSNCLETYSYDHSIYFKTVGEIRRSKCNLHQSDYESNDLNHDYDWKTMHWKVEFDDLGDEMIEFQNLSTDNLELEKYHSDVCNNEEVNQDDVNNNYNVSAFGEPKLFIQM